MEFNCVGVAKWFLIAGLMVALLVCFVASTGCVTMAKEQYREITKTPVPTPTPPPPPTPTPTPTPLPTPTSIPTLAQHYVDPYMHGERWEGQWFKWLRNDVQGINGEGTKDLHIGVIVYRHMFVDKLTYYNNLWGQYYEVKPSDGKRFFIVWVHEEMMGDNATYDPSMWSFDEKAFRLQAYGSMLTNTHPVVPQYTIKELDNYFDFYNTIIAPPFGYFRVYTSHASETGGWEVQQRGYLRMGKGNAEDGYLIYEVPKDIYEKDLALHGGFSTFGSAYWRFI